MSIKNKKWLPFSLTAFIILADQISKALVVATMPLVLHNSRVSASVDLIGDFLRFTHIRNTAILFSIGQNFPPLLKTIFFVIAPVILLVLLIVFYFRSKEIKWNHRWILAGILGGGFGNMIDRIFRTDGVVDFIDVKFYGLFGMERWPTFNIADSAIVVSAIFLLIILISEEITVYKNKKRSAHEQKN